MGPRSLGWFRTLILNTGPKFGLAQPERLPLRLKKLPGELLSQALVVGDPRQYTTNANEDGVH